MAKYIMIVVLAGMVTFGISNINLNNTLGGGTNNSVYNFGFNRSHSIATSMGDIILMRLASDFDYRVNTPVTEDLFDGEATFSVEDTFFEGDSLVKITVAGNFNGITKNVITYASKPGKGWVPPMVRGAWTANSTLNNTISDMYIDGRDHDLNLNLIPSTGVYGVSTSVSFVNNDKAEIGGTNNKIDYPMTFPEVAEVIEENYNWGGQFPLSPDEALGLPEGTLKAAAQTGEYGSQYLLNPEGYDSRNYIDGLNYPLSGVTYIEITNGDEYELMLEQNGNSGILVIHNDDRNSNIQGIKYDKDNSDGLLTGLLMTDYSFHHHINVLGSIVMLSPDLEEDKNCNGNKDHWVYYSSEAISNATETVAEITGESYNVGYGFGKKRLNVRYVHE